MFISTPGNRSSRHNHTLMFSGHYILNRLSSFYLSKSSDWQPSPASLTSPDIELLLNPSQTRTETFTSQGHMDTTQTYDVTWRRDRSVTHEVGSLHSNLHWFSSQLQLKPSSSSSLHWKTPHLHWISPFSLLFLRSVDFIKGSNEVNWCSDFTFLLLQSAWSSIF